MTIEKRIKDLEQVQQDRADAMPLLDFRWTGPDPTRNRITFAVDGYGVIDQWDGESDGGYKARAFALCKKLFQNRRELPLLQVFIPNEVNNES